MAKSRGRPVGATTRPQFYTYITEIERKQFVDWIKKSYQKDTNLAKWYGEQMFGKALQPLGNPDGSPFFDNETKRKANQAIQEFTE